ncbi:MAG TPA: hypothetical protein VFQ53_43520 [Kofleriaceae bacterium]|nr:hypothetical protein [Kofleriaceae bacterium]
MSGVRVLSILLLAACASEGGTSGPSVESRVVHKEFPIAAPAKLDLLFVVDNSPAIAAHRANLVDNAHRFAAVLESFAGGLPDVHIGVITTDVGTRGADDPTSTASGDCTADGDAGRLRTLPEITGRFLADFPNTTGNRVRNYTGDLGNVLASLLDAGATGCSFVRPLEAIRRALANPNNVGFLRDRAYLGVLVITARDDCSFTRSSFAEGAVDTFGCVTMPSALEPVEEFAAVLQGAKLDPYDVAVAAISGPASPFVIDESQRTIEPSCTFDTATGPVSAEPAVRLQAFLDQFPNRSTFSSICQADLSGAFAQIAQLPKVSLGLPCIDTPLLDIDPQTPGDQYECSVSLRDVYPDRVEERLIYECTGGPTACWTITPEPNLGCPYGVAKVANTFGATDADHTLAVFECVAP